MILMSAVARRINDNSCPREETEGRKSPHALPKIRCRSIMNFSQSRAPAADRRLESPKSDDTGGKHVIKARHGPLCQSRLAREAADALLSGQAALFAGAGVSMARQSRLPGWPDMIRALLQQFAGPAGRREFRYVTSPRNDYMRLLFNEQALQLTVEVLGLESTASALTACLDSPHHSRSHRMFAWAQRRCGATLLTTNFDELIERAGARPDCVLKLHGTLSRLSEARFTVDNVFSPLDRSLLRPTQDCLAGRTLIVVGYGGEDEFDVVPALLDEKRGPSRVIWVSHHDGHGEPQPLSDSVVRRFQTLGTRAVALAADTDRFLKQVYQAVVGRDASLVDPELEDWQVRRIRTGQADAGWWKSGVHAWGRKLRRERSPDVAYLWARILEHLRIYQVRGRHGEVHNFAADAFERFRQWDGVTTERLLDADARLAAMRRTIGQPDMREFASVLRRIKHAIGRTADSDVRSKLERLSGRTQQQFASAYFGVGLKTKSRRHVARARELVTQTIAYRRAIRDPEVAYTLFSQFIMAYYVDKNGLGDFEDFAPPRWRKDLLPELKQAATRFRRKRQPEHCGTTQHNVAFVYQVLAERHEAAGEQVKARTMYRRAIAWCEKGRAIRTRLRDPRMIAQSEVRIAQCKLALARLVSRKDLKKRLIGEAERSVAEVKSLYDRTPQEGHRLDDIKELRAAIASMRKINP